MLRIVDFYCVLQNAMFKLSGEGNSIATKIDQDWNNENCLVTEQSRVFDSGKHRDSIKLIQGGAANMSAYCGSSGGWRSLGCGPHAQ